MPKSKEVEAAEIAAAEIETVDDLGTEVILGTPQGQGIVRSEVYQSLITWYWDTFPSVAEDSDMIYAQVTERILHTSADNILDLAETLDSARLWVNTPIMLIGVDKVMPSAFGGFYVICAVVDLSVPEEDREVQPLAIGSPSLLAQLKVMYDAGQLPLECKIVPIQRPREGRNPVMYFRRVDYKPRRTV